MKAFYTILYATLNPVIREQISVGLMLTGENEVFFDYSQKKLSHLNAFMPKHANQLLKDALKNIRHTVDKTKEQQELDGLDLDIKGLKERVFTEQYIDYLSRYNKNLLSFSSPVQIDIKPDEENFKVLFEKYIYKEPSSVKYLIKSIHTNVEEKLYPRIKGKVNLDADLGIQDIETLAIPVRVNFIGKNEQPVAGKTIDFQSGNYHLEANFGHFISLIKAFDDKKEKGKYYVIGDEPEKKYEKQHNLWKHIQGLHYMDLVPSNETDRIAEYIEKHHVQPYLL
jgi:hypothetical protein